MARGRRGFSRRPRVVRVGNRTLAWTAFDVEAADVVGGGPTLFSNVILNRGSWQTMQGFERATIRRIIMFIEATSTQFTAGTAQFADPPRVLWAIRLGKEEELANAQSVDDPSYFDEEDILNTGRVYFRLANANTIALTTSFQSAGTIPSPPVDIRVMRKVDSDSELMLDTQVVGNTGALWAIRATGRVLMQLHGARSS